MKNRYKIASCDDSESCTGERIEANLGNYYGRVGCCSCVGGCRLTLANYDGLYAIEVSREFYDAFKKEFGND